MTRFRRAEPYLYILPIFIGIVVVTGGAVVAAFAIGFTEWDIVRAPQWVGLRNYVEMFNSELFGGVLGNTLYYVALSVPLSIVGSLGLALLVNRRLRGMAFFRTAYFLPVVTSMVAVAIVWSWLYNPEFGAINFLLKKIFGIADGPRWLLSTGWALPSMVLMSVWKGLGYNMLIILAGLQSVPLSLEEVALLDGAGPVRRFFTVTLPMISPTLFFVIVITAIGSFQTFEQTYMLTQGGPGNSTLTLGYFIYQNGFQFFKMGYATALAYVLFALTFAVTVLQFRLQKRWVFYQ